MKQKINKKIKTFTLTSRTFALIIVMLSIIGTLAIIYAKTRPDKNSYSNPDTQQITSPQDVNYSGPSDAEKEQVETNKTKDNQSTKRADDDSSQAIKSIKISNAYQEYNGDLVVQTELVGFGWKECNLSIQKGNSVIARKVDSIYQPNFSTCLGFSIPISDIESSGQWKIELNTSNVDGKLYTADEKIIEIKK